MKCFGSSGYLMYRLLIGGFLLSNATLYGIISLLPESRREGTRKGYRPEEVSALSLSSAPGLH